MPYCEVSKLARGVHSQDVYRVPDGRKYCASMGSRCFPGLFPISWQKLITARSPAPSWLAGVRPLSCTLRFTEIGLLQGPIAPQVGYRVP